MGLTLITPAASLAVSVAEAKAWCRIDGAADDALLSLLIETASAQIEEMTGRALVEQAWRLTLDEFSDSIELPKGPVSAVSSVKYYDAAGALQTLAGSVYSLDLVSDPQWLVLNAGESWPDLLDAVNVVTIDFTTGYSEVPPQLRTALLMLVAQWYDNRAPGEVPAGVAVLIERYRTGWFAA